MLFRSFLFLLAFHLMQLLVEEGGEEHERTWNAIAAALMVTLGMELIDYVHLFSRLIHGSTSEVLSVWTRPVNPITGALFLFTFLCLLWQSIRKESWEYSIVAGVTLGLSFGYIFSLGTGLSVLGILVIFALFARDYARIKKFFTILFIGTIIPLIYWINILPQLTKGDDLAGRSGLLLIHTPLFNKVLLATFVLCGALLTYAYQKHEIRIWKQREKHLPIWFSLALIFGSIFALNQQILTGRAIWPYHFVQYTVPLAMISVYIFAFFLFRPFFPRTWMMFIGASITVCMVFSTLNAGTFVFRMKDFRQLQDLSPIFSWLNANAPKDCVVLTSEDSLETLTGLIPGFTTCNTYVSSYLGGSMPMERVYHNFFTKLRLHGITNATIMENLTEKNDEAPKMYFYKDWIELLSPNKDPRIEKTFPDLTMKYELFLKEDFEKELRRYRIDYIISRGELNTEAVRSLPTLQPVFTSGSTTIYALK